MNRQRLGLSGWTAGLAMAAVIACCCCGGVWGQSKPTAGSSLPTSSPASARPDAMDASHQSAAAKLIDDGVKFLLSQREADGGWSAGPTHAYKPALTALVLKALLAHRDYAPDTTNPIVKQGFEVLLKYRQKDGGIYNPQEGQAAYTTALAVMAMKASGDPQYNQAIRDAAAYLKGLQILPGQESPDGKAIEASDPRVGGVGYGKPPAFQPNLSVLGFVMDAWEDAGIPADDPAVQRAAAFLLRLQNRSESNTLTFAKEGANDGGFVYALAESKAGSEGKDGLRSYGSMTYVGFKSMLYAGLAKDDPRVQAAYGWIRKYWGLDSNPNMPGKDSQQGLFYYYVMFAKALHAWGQPVIVDAKGREHNWREELIDALASRVQKDGSWENTADRWEEGSKVLVTGYCVQALEEAMRK